jgi:S-(hydroxymethyl)glutathione dehydrogenase/alcohol dehydrogenase
MGSLFFLISSSSDLTRGVMADSALLTVGVVEGPMINDAFNIIRKGGAVVLEVTVELLMKGDV